MCLLLITFVNSLDPDQARQNVGPYLDSNCLILMVFLKEFFEKVDFEKSTNIISRKELTIDLFLICMQEV